LYPAPVDPLAPDKPGDLDLAAFGPAFRNMVSELYKDVLAQKEAKSKELIDKLWQVTQEVMGTKESKDA